MISTPATGTLAVPFGLRFAMPVRRLFETTLRLRGLSLLAYVEVPEAGGQRGGMGQRLFRALVARLGGRVETTPGNPSGTVHTIPALRAGRG